MIEEVGEGSLVVARLILTVLLGFLIAVLIVVCFYQFIVSLVAIFLYVWDKFRALFKRHI